MTDCYFCHDNYLCSVEHQSTIYNPTDWIIWPSFANIFLIFDRLQTQLSLVWSLSETKYHKTQDWLRLWPRLTLNCVRSENQWLSLEQSYRRQLEYSGFMKDLNTRLILLIKISKLRHGVLFKELDTFVHSYTAIQCTVHCNAPGSEYL